MLPATLVTLSKNVQLIHFFQPFHISQCLHTEHGIFLLFHSNNVHHDVFVPRELHFMFYEWMPMMFILYQKIVAFVESEQKIYSWSTYWSQSKYTIEKYSSSPLVTWQTLIIWYIKNISWIPTNRQTYYLVSKI